MKANQSFLTTVILSMVIVSCSESSGDEESQDNEDNQIEEITSGLVISGSVRGTEEANLSGPMGLLRRADFNDDPSRCPDDSAGGVSANISPETYTVALKRLTLIGDGITGIEDYDVFSAETLDDAFIADLSGDDTTFFSSENYPPAGTYYDLEVEVFYIEQTIPMIIPAVSDEEAVYRTRGYFTDTGNLEKRDVTVFVEDVENWINRQTDIDEAFELVEVTEDHPFQVLDLWSDETFWDRDPVTISTSLEFAAFGTGFSFGFEEGESGLVIPEIPDGLYEITMSFDVTDTFTFWEYLENNMAEDADGSYTVGYDCGYRFFFPNVSIAIEESESTE